MLPVTYAVRGRALLPRSPSLRRSKNSGVGFETAGGEGNKYHNHCDCIPVPVVGRWVVDSSTQRGYRWEGQSPGYDFEELYATEYKPYWCENDTIHDVLARCRQAKAAARNEQKLSKKGKTKVPEYVAEWPEGIPSKLDGIRPYASLEHVPRITGNTAFEHQVSSVNPRLDQIAIWPEVWGSNLPYNINCVRCSTVLLLRRKGFSLGAGAGSYIPKERGFNTGTAVSFWKDAEGIPLELSPLGKGNKQAFSECEGTSDIGSYGYMRCSWKGRK
nr:hypothetical protein [Mobiluncus mulieris]